MSFDLFACISTAIIKTINIMCACSRCMYLLAFDTFVFSILTITLGSYLLCRKVNNLGSIFFSHQQKIKICSDHAYYITPVTTLKTRHGTTISSVHVIIGRYRFKLGALSDVVTSTLYLCHFRWWFYFYICSYSLTLSRIQAVLI